MRRYWVVVGFLLFLFWFTRLYQIQNTFFFFNDTGRDYLVLQDFVRTHKPPLLGPQTSALPFNQSVVYFLILVPVFILTSGSVFSNHLTLLIFYSIFYLLGAWWLRHQTKLRYPYLLSVFLLILYPLLIIQNRYIWNPSFLAPLILGSIFTLISLNQTWSKTKVILLGFFISLANAISYSCAPYLIALLLISPIFFKRKAISIWLSVIGFSLFWQIPTLLFELRHNFLLTKAVLTGQYIVQNRVVWTDKLIDLAKIALPPMTATTGMLLIGSILFISLMIIFLHRNYSQRKYLLLIFVWWITTLLITLIVKVEIQPHFIFPLIILLFTQIAFFPAKISWLYLFFLMFYWSSPGTISGFYKTAPHTVKEFTACAIKVCQNQTAPMYLSVQAGYHPYHMGPEFRYLFNKYGCLIKSVEYEPGTAAKMAVVVDNSTYTHNQTSFNELTLFGPSQVDTTINCNQGLEVIILKK